MRTMKFRPLAAIAVVGASGFVIAGCSSSGGSREAVTLQLAATSDADADAYATLIEAFEEENPTITVETTFSPVDAYQANVPRSMSSANGPDIVAAFPGLELSAGAHTLFLDHVRGDLFAL